MTENNEEKRGMGEALKELMGKLFSNFKHLFKAIVNKFANNKEAGEKLSSSALGISVVVVKNYSIFFTMTR